MSVSGNVELRFSEEQAMLLDVAREFCRDRSPMAAVREQLETEAGFDAGLWDEMVGLGWTGIALPEAYGGAGLDVGSVVPVLESMGRAMLGTPLLSSTLAAQLILRAGTEAQRDALLPELAAGAPATVALLEGGDWGAATPQCSLDADGYLSGEKEMVCDARAARWFAVSVSAPEGLAIALVNADQLREGTLREHTLIDQTRRAASVDFTGVRVPPSHILSGTAAAAALRDALLLGALLTAAEATGSTAACLDTTVDYLKTRKQFGKLIGSYQALKHPCVDILCDVDSARSFLYHAATLVNDGPLSQDAEIACRMAKAHATEALLYAGDRSVQFHGGMGFTYECDASLFVRRAQWSRQQFGDALHHRKRLAGLLLDGID
ncbi:MAG: acyl-CoA dehydrogenase family protein [Pseudomonadota bacterium]